MEDRLKNREWREFLLVCISILPYHIALAMGYELSYIREMFLVLVSLWVIGY